MLLQSLTKSIRPSIRSIFVDHASNKSKKVLETEYNRVVLCGTVIGVRNARNGSDSCEVLLKTVHNKLTPIHTVVTKNRPFIVEGQKVVFRGWLISNLFNTDNGKLRQRFIVKAYHGFGVDNDSTDVNYTELMAYVASDVYNLDTVSHFSTAVHFISKSTSNPVTCHFNAVFYNDSERENIRSTLQKSDKILLTGKLKYDRVNNADGRKFVAGTILGDTIIKLIPRSGEQNDSDSSNVEGA